MNTPSIATSPGNAPDAADGFAVATDSVPVIRPSALASPEPLGEALYNPFATTGIVLQVPAVEPVVDHRSPAGDWSLPVTVTFAGFIFIGWMLRMMVQ